MKAENVIIIGSGPAGFTAAIYTARAGLNPLVIEGYQSGGQLMITNDVENFPGFPNGVQGPALMENFRKQAERFGARLITKDATSVNLEKDPKLVVVEDKTYEAKTVIIATGASARFLGLPSEKKFLGKGVSACATCDGAFFKNEEVFIVGGGDTALEEALFLTRFASKVSIVHRRDQLRGSKIMQDKVKNNPKIKIIWDSVLDEVLGGNVVTGVRLKNVKTAEKKEYNGTGVFIAVGHTPNTKLFEGQIDLSDTGYIRTKNNVETNIPGVFACGDVQDPTYRQAVTAAGSGCMAAIAAEKYLSSSPNV